MDIIKWFKQSNRFKHLIGGGIIGLFSNGWYCALYASICAASSLELKDKLKGGKWDYIDWILTIIGSIISFGILHLII